MDEDKTGLFETIKYGKLDLYLSPDSVPNDIRDEITPKIVKDGKISIDLRAKKWNAIALRLFRLFLLENNFEPKRVSKHGLSFSDSQVK